MRVLMLVVLSGSFLFAQAPPAPAASGEEAAASGQQATITLPAGTKVPLSLKNAITTKTAKPGDPVYLVTTFPVTRNDEMLIPPGTYVQGVISQVTRPGRVKGRAELLVHFNTLIFPNGYTVSLPGSLDNVSGDENSRVVDKEGTVEHNGEKGKDVGTIAGTGATGAMIGAAAGGGKGALLGAATGGATGLLISMLTRGSDVRFEAGTTMEMVLQRPLVLQEARLHRTGRNFVPLKPADRLERRELTPPPDPQ